MKTKTVKGEKCLPQFAQVPTIPRMVWLYPFYRICYCLPKLLFVSAPHSMLHLSVIFENRLAVRHIVKVITMFPVLKCCLNDQNKMKQTALHLAVNLNLNGVVEELILAGAELDLQDINGNTPFHIVCKKGLLQCMDTFLSIVNNDKLRKIAELTNNEGEKPSRCAVNGILVLPFLSLGYNALHLAVMQSNVKVIRRLCNIGCDINMQVRVYTVGRE